MFIQKKTYKSISLILKYEFKRLFLKSILFNPLLSSHIRAKAYKKLILLNKRTSLTYIRLKCILTQRTRSLLTFFKLSRISFKKMYSTGALIGLRKSSR
jgi:small subunit ribosomal protein S14